MGSDWTAGQRIAAVAGVALMAAGGSALGLAVASQQHAPVPGTAQAGAIGPIRHDQPGSPARKCGPPRCGTPMQARSLPVSVTIPAIDVHARLLYVGRNPDGTIQVPPLNDAQRTNEAAWYRYSPTPGQRGASIIEGHVDSARDGPSVFFRLGSLRPGDQVDVTLTDRKVAVFLVTGVRLYAKDKFPTKAVFNYTDYAALRLITCGGGYDYQTHHYLANVVVFAALVSTHPASASAARDLSPAPSGE